MSAAARRPRRRFGPAEEVASRPRERLLSGAVDDGALLPKIDDLLIRDCAGGPIR
ncbi:MAG: hypothetical protein F2876_07595 [Actinobacteria bacterium]|uniref:Unannotated protein n=1 Tax=freshwater metagenome TaxID=449393 RepID=A0A6J7P908_9ZZZZ|nr:hypothetical protein [Actinomycetota bacterium]